MLHIYIDESGDLGLSEKSSRVLVISSIMVNDPKPLDRIITNARRNKFRKELQTATEIKANKSSPELRRYLIEKLNDVKDIQGIHCILDKRKLYSEFLKNDKNKLYNYVAGPIASAINVNLDIVDVRIDKSKGKYILREDFNSYFERRLRMGSNILKVEFHHSYSQNFSGIQIADVMSWATYQKYNHSDPSYLNMSNFPQTFIELWKPKI